MPRGRITYDVQGETDELKTLIRKKIVAAVPVPGLSRYVVAAKGVNLGSLRKIAAKEAEGASRQ